MNPMLHGDSVREQAFITCNGAVGADYDLVSVHIPNFDSTVYLQACYQQLTQLGRTFIIFQETPEKKHHELRSGNHR